MNRSQPGGNRAEELHSTTKAAVREFKPCAKIGQTTLLDSRGRR
jgi:hypothetical protein